MAPALRALPNAVRSGPVTGPLERDPWAAFRYVRIGGATPFDDDTFSTLKDAVVVPSFKKPQVNWPDALLSGKLDQQGMAHAQAIADELAKPDENTLVLTRDYFSQSVDTAALEPDNANGWYDPAKQELHMVVPKQSPIEVAQSMHEMVEKAGLPLQNLFVHPCYTVGYGSKDHCTFPFHGVIAAFYGAGKPVRLANDRFEQFQTSLKRHSIRMHYQMAIDKQSGKIRAFKAEFQLGPCLARGRRGLGAWLRHAAGHGGDRDAHGRGGHVARARPGRAPAAQRAAVGHEEQPGRHSGRRRAGRRGHAPAAAAPAVDGARTAQDRVRGAAPRQA